MRLAGNAMAAAGRRGKIVAFGRDHRRPPRWGMGLPPRSRPPKPPKPHGPLSGLGIKVILVAIAALILVGPAGDTLNGWWKAGGGCRVTTVIDGDTIRFACPGRETPSGRLLGFDTPEMFSPRCPGELLRAIAATYALRFALFSAARISLVVEGRDRYDRALVRARIDGQDVAGRMIAGGWARAYDGGARKGWC